MQVSFRPCVFEKDQDAYIRFLIERHNELGLPYPFAMNFSFFASPLLFGGAMLAIDPQRQRTIGAAGFVLGTGAQQYEDRQVCQIEVAFLLEEYRGTYVFPRFLRALVDLMRTSEPDVRQVQFWADTRQTKRKRLYDKLLVVPGSTVQRAENGLSLYQTPYAPLEAFLNRKQL